MVWHHSSDGQPARVWRDGQKEWLSYGQYHRLEGPARIYADGRQEWYLDGKELTQEKWAQVPRVIELHSRTQEGAEEWLKQM